MSGGCAVVGGMSVTGLDFVEADAGKEEEAEVLMVDEAAAVALSDSLTLGSEGFSKGVTWVDGLTSPTGEGGRADTIVF